MSFLKNYATPLTLKVGDRKSVLSMNSMYVSDYQLPQRRNKYLECCPLPEKHLTNEIHMITNFDFSFKCSHFLSLYAVLTDALVVISLKQ